MKNQNTQQKPQQYKSQIYGSQDQSEMNQSENQFWANCIPEAYRKNITQITKSLTSHYSRILRHVVTEYRKMYQKYNQTKKKLSECQIQSMLLAEFIKDKIQQLNKQLSAEKDKSKSLQEQLQKVNQQKDKIQLQEIKKSSQIETHKQVYKESMRTIQKQTALNEKKQIEIKKLKENLSIQERAHHKYVTDVQASYEKQKDKMKQEHQINIKEKLYQIQLHKQSIEKLAGQIQQKQQNINNILKERKNAEINLNKKEQELFVKNAEQLKLHKKFEQVNKVFKNLNNKAKQINKQQNKQNLSFETIIQQCWGQYDLENTSIYSQVAEAISNFATLKCSLLMNQIFQDCISSVYPDQKKQLKENNSKNVQNIMSQLNKGKFSKVWPHFEKILDNVLNIQLQGQSVRFAQASKKINTRISDLQTKLREQTEKLQRNNQKIGQAGSKTQQLNSQITRLNREFKKLSGQIQQQKYQKKNLIKSTEDMKKRYQSQIESLQNKIRNIQGESDNKIKAQANEVSSLKANLSRIQRNSEVLKQTIRERDQSIKTANAQIKQLMEQIKAINSQIKKKDEQINNLINHKKQAQKNISHASRIHTQSSDKLNQQIKKNQMLSSQIKELQEVLANAQKYERQILEEAQRTLQRKLKDQQREMNARFQKVLSVHFKDIDFKFDSLSQMEQKISEQLSKKKNNPELITSQILNQAADQKAFLIEKVNKFVQKKIVSSEFVYKWDKNINTDFTSILKDRKNLILIFKVQQKDYRFGFFIEKIGLSESTATDRAFLFSLTDKKAFYKLGNLGAQARSVFFALTASLIYFGNKEIRIRNKSNVINSTYGGFGKTYFDVKDKNQLFGISKDEITFSNMEVHCLKFE